MDLKLTVIGNSELGQKYAKRSKDMPGGIQRIISKVALTVERYGKNYSPVDTGLMRSTIYPVDITKLETWVGPKTDYAKYVHARVPFMFAAREDTLPSVPNIISEEIRKVLK